MSPSVNKSIVIIGGDEIRNSRFQKALHAHNLPPAKHLTYRQIMEDTIDFAKEIKPNTVIRLESPGKSVSENLAFLLSGLKHESRDALRSIWEPNIVEVNLKKDGLHLPSHQWGLGLNVILSKIEESVSNIENVTFFTPPAAILSMFNKLNSAKILEEIGVSTPPKLGVIENYAQLREMAGAARMNRLFVKPVFGSSAAGIIALQWGQGQVKAITTLLQDGSSLYNTRKLRKIISERELKGLVDRLALEYIFAEMWVPKLTIDQMSVDFRVIVIDGAVTHAVARLNKEPMTNLNLGSERRNISAVINQIGSERWKNAEVLCLEAMKGYPGAFYAGIDVGIPATGNKPVIFEVNAFGDLLFRVLHRGDDTYTTEIKRFFKL